MSVLEGKCIGNVNVEVYQTQDGKTFFYLQGNSPKMIPVLDYLENSLEKY